MYGGDEVNAVVVDVGSYTVKAGYAGDDVPKAVFPSWVGKVPGELRKGSGDGGLDGAEGETAKAEDTEGEGGSGRKQRQRYHVGLLEAGYRRDDMEVVSGLKQGLYDDWEIVEALWEHAFHDRLRIKPSEHPIMLAEPTNSEKPVREKAVETMFETHGPPAIFLAKNAALSSFAVGRQTSLVMDCGYEATTVAAVHDGYVLQKSICRAPLAGQLLNRCMESAVQQSCSVELRPRFAFKRKLAASGNMEVIPQDLPRTTESYKRFMKEQIAADIKEFLCRVQESALDEEQNKHIPNVTYELPDGQEIQVGIERFKVPEVLFNPSIITSFQGLEPLKTEDGAEVSGLPQMVLESINKCDVDVRKDLVNGVVLTGGTSCLHQLRERLERDLAGQVSNARVRVTTSPSAIEKKFSVWIGG
eukprot:CAMPEP_0177603596 /NCGR_PEP_ID=MMETSP0419_2-20121207/15605_1 /TAXON_ID=582737 /ORGANISM="Tetraselmis sp., Strain GSL018" /LENGTH=415 /DNA_ID=CAMNT_0019097395 /DNA_START=48 /DNA_END=1292 /DNA_ORIENTATION=+